MKVGDLVYFSDRGNAMFLIKDNIKNQYGLLLEYKDIPALSGEKVTWRIWNVLFGETISVIYEGDLSLVESK
mgnify:CR=1 FL=1|jgi:hypothetical protein